MEKSKLNKEFDKAFGAFVKAKRLKKGWTQQDLSDKLGNNFQNISRMERGELTPTLFWCCKLAEVFEMDLAKFLKGFTYDVME